MLNNVYDDGEEDFEFNCSLCEKIKLWFHQWKTSEINSITLTIRDPVLHKKFSKVELLAVKRRWEISTICFTVLAIVTTILNWSSKNKLFSFLLSIGDL